MKKLTGLFLALLCVIVAISLPVSAGDVPESLLHSEDAQLFFGKVLAYHPSKEAPDIEVSPVAVIKGDVTEGSSRIYFRPNPMGNFPVRVGHIYLFAYYDEANYTDIFDVTTYDTRTLKLRHVKGSMWDRFEKYLNQGQYGVAKVDNTHTYSVDMICGAMGIVIFLSAAGTLYIFRKKKDRTASG